MNLFESVRCSKNYVRLFDECFSKSSEGLLGSKFDVSSFEVKIQVCEFDHQYMNKFEFVWCLKNDVWVVMMFNRMAFDQSIACKSKTILACQAFLDLMKWAVTELNSFALLGWFTFWENIFFFFLKIEFWMEC